MENDGTFFIAVQDYVEHFRCTTINYETTQTVKISSVEHDFNEENDDQKAYQLASFSLSLSKSVDLSSEIFAITINQQGDRLTTYRNTGANKFQPARFNILLLHHPSGNGPA
jgi:hypothetical protein